MTAEIGREAPDREGGEWRRCDDCRLLMGLETMQPKIINGETELTGDGRAVMICTDCGEAYR